MDQNLNKPTNESNPEVPASENTVHAKKKSLKNNKWFWVGLVAALVVLAGVAYVIVTMLLPKPVEDKDADLSQATHFASPQALVEKVKPELRGPVVEIATLDGLGGHTSDLHLVYSVPSHQVDGRKFINFPMASFGTSYKGDAKQAEKNFAALTKFFTDNKFKQYETGKDTSGLIAWGEEPVSYINSAVYESGNLLCEIDHVDATNSPLKAHISSVGCGDKASYAKAAEGLQQYYDAYVEGEDKLSDAIILGRPSTGDSMTAGYKVAVVYTEDTGALDGPFEGQYFKKPGDSKWTYFNGSDGLFNCADYNTDDLKNAFSGFACYDEATDSEKTVGTSKVAPVLK